MLRILMMALVMLPLSMFCQTESEKSAAAIKTILAPDLMNKSEWKEKLQMGNPASSNEIYVITDWLCPGCQAKEPDLEKMLPKILQNNKVYFIDLANHHGSADFVKYNLSFLLNNKDDYLKLRPILHKFSETGKAPTKEEMEKELAKLHIKYTPLPYSQINEISNYFTAAATALKVTGTPTLILKNVKTNKMKSFVGDYEEATVLKSLEEIQKP